MDKAQRKARRSHHGPEDFDPVQAHEDNCGTAGDVSWYCGCGLPVFSQSLVFPVYCWVGLVCGDANLARTQGLGSACGEAECRIRPLTVIDGERRSPLVAGQRNLFAVLKRESGF